MRYVIFKILYVFPKISDFIESPYDSSSSCRKKGRSWNENAVTLISRIVIISSKKQSIMEIGDQDSKSVISSSPQEFCHINVQSVTNQSNCSPNMNGILHAGFEVFQNYFWSHCMIRCWLNKSLRQVMRHLVKVILSNSDTSSHTV